MTSEPAALGLLGLLAILCVAAAVSDLRSRSISNPLNGAIALLAVPFWIAMGLDPWPQMAFQIALAVAVLALFAVFFAINAMGGGDVKFIAALALWMPAGIMLKLLVYMFIIGGILTVAVVAWHKLRKTDLGVGIPYGVAIALAGLWGLHEQYINQFT